MFDRGDNRSIRERPLNLAEGAKDYINPLLLSNPLPHRPIFI
jgi:hypothetical protein